MMHPPCTNGNSLHTQIAQPTWLICFRTAFQNDAHARAVETTKITDLPSFPFQTALRTHLKHAPEQCMSCSFSVCLFLRPLSHTIVYNRHKNCWQHTPSFVNKQASRVYCLRLLFCYTRSLWTAKYQASCDACLLTNDGICCQQFLCLRYTIVC